MSKVAIKLNQLLGDQSQRRLADQLGLSKDMVHRWLKGESEPSLANTLILARHFGVSMEWLADDEQDERPASPPRELQQLLEAAERIGYGLALDRVLAKPESRPPPGESWGEMKGSEPRR